MNCGVQIAAKMHEQTKFIVAALGIFFSYFYYGIVQEKITRSRYGETRNEDGTSYSEKFTFTLTLVGVQCLWNWIFAKGKYFVCNKENVKLFTIKSYCNFSLNSSLVGLTMLKPEKEDKTHYGYYACSAVTYLLAMVSSNMALRWVPYPTQVIGKSAKPIPVMLLGVLIGHKRYTLQRYCFVFTIVIGVVLFMMKEGKVNSSSAAAAAVAEQSFGIGEVLLIMSLSMDGLLGAIQERMRAAYSPTGQQMMVAMNGWSTLFLLVAAILTGEIFEFISFANRYPYVLMHLAALSVTGALGQLFIFIMVSSYGPLACSVVTTTRKFFTVLFSVLFFGNVLTGRQWFGAFLVFLGLFADAAFGKSAPKKTDKSEKPLINK